MRSQLRGWLAGAVVTLTAVGLTACGGGGDGSSTAANSSGSSSAATNPTPVASGQSTSVRITGTPAGSVVAGSAYSFTPVATVASGANISYSVQNKPQWASFDTATGRLSGTPTAANVGSYSNIIVTVTDGSASASLPAFTVTVTQMGTGSVTLSWNPPSENTDGSALTNPAGYKIYYGNDANLLSQSVTVSTVGLTTFQVSNLGSGTWYFAVTTYTASGMESDLSNVATKVI